MSIFPSSVERLVLDPRPGSFSSSGADGVRSCVGVKTLPDLYNSLVLKLMAMKLREVLNRH